MNELVRGSHTTGECCLHMQFTIAYRREVLRVEKMDKIIKVYLRAAAFRIGINLEAMEVGPDHVHIFVKGWKRHSISELAQKIKGYISRMIRKRYAHLLKYYLWGNKFWSAGYFYRTVGAVTAEKVQYYIEETQSKHW